MTEVKIDDADAKKPASETDVKKVEATDDPDSRHPELYDNPLSGIPTMDWVRPERLNRSFGGFQPRRGGRGAHGRGRGRGAPINSNVRVEYKCVGTTAKSTRPVLKFNIGSHVWFSVDGKTQPIVGVVDAIDWMAECLVLDSPVFCEVPESEQSDQYKFNHYPDGITVSGPTLPSAIYYLQRGTQTSCWMQEYSGFGTIIQIPAKRVKTPPIINRAFDDGLIEIVVMSAPEPSYQISTTTGGYPDVAEKFVSVRS